MPYELFIGLRYLKAKRKSTFISIITVISTSGVALGVLALIVVLAVMTGFEEDLKTKIMGTNAHVVVLGGGSGIQDYSRLMDRVKKFDGVTAVTPFIYSQVMLTSGKSVSGVVLRGIDIPTESQVTNLHLTICDGSINDLETVSGTPLADSEPPLPGIMIGRELSRNLNLYVGDKLNVVSPMGNITPLGMIPKMKKFKVVALFNTGMYEYDSTLAYVTLSEAQEFLGMGGTVTGLQLKVADVYHTGEMVKELNSGLGSPFHSRDWMQMNKNILFALKTEKMVMFIILTLIVLVAAFGIASTLFMVVMEKTKDIAILKSMGATGRSIMKIFVLEGLIIGITGTVIGMIGGLLISYNLQTIVDVVQRLTGFELFSKDVYYLDHFPSKVVPGDVAMICVTAVVISLLATLYPAWQASRMAPAEALRYE